MISICPELIGGLSVPRHPAEIESKASGEAVLSGEARVFTADGADLTAYFLAGATATLALAKAEGCQFALLVDGSPSCGSSFIYDGSFSGRRHGGVGVTTAMLRANDISVFSDKQVDALAQAVRDHRW